LSKVIYHDDLRAYIECDCPIAEQLYLQNDNGMLRLQIISKSAGESPFILVEMGQLLDVLRKINLLVPGDKSLGSEEIKKNL